MVARNASPLAIGFSDDMVIVASDATAMAHLTQKVTYLKDNDYAILTSKSHIIYNGENEMVNREAVKVNVSPILLDKLGLGITWKKKSMNNQMRLVIQFQR